MVYVCRVIKREWLYETMLYTFYNETVGHTFEFETAFGHDFEIDDMVEFRLDEKTKNQPVGPADAETDPRR